MKVLLAAAVLLAAVSVSAEDKVDSHVPLYVYAAVDAAGFMDVHAARAVENFGQQRFRFKYVRPVKTRAEARLVLEVTRYQEETSDLDPYQYATLTFGGYTTEIRGQSYRGGRTALAAVVEAWAKANQEKLR